MSQEILSLVEMLPSANVVCFTKASTPRVRNLLCINKAFPKPLEVRVGELLKESCLCQSDPDSHPEWCRYLEGFSYGLSQAFFPRKEKC